MYALAEPFRLPLNFLLRRNCKNTEENFRQNVNVECRTSHEMWALTIAYLKTVLKYVEFGGKVLLAPTTPTPLPDSNGLQLLCRKSSLISSTLANSDFEHRCFISTSVKIFRWLFPWRWWCDLLCCSELFEHGVGG